MAHLINNRKIWNNIRDFIAHPYFEQDAREIIGFCNQEDPKMTFAIEYEGEFVGAVGLVPQTDECSIKRYIFAKIKALKIFVPELTCC